VKPSVTLAETTLSGGSTLSLCMRDGHYHLRVAGRELMSTATTSSEERLAELACEKVGTTSGTRVLIGGLGFGFTLRRALELVHPDVKVQVAELLPEVVAWNREHLQSVNGGLVDDARVEIQIDDVLAVLARANARQYDAVLLDIDNGPAPIAAGLQVLSRALRVGGRAVFWSASTDRAFLKQLTQAGFLATAVGAKAHAQAKRDTHTLFIADWPG
jgi:spermidine synthase